MTGSQRRHAGGFTLLEVLVAIFIFSLVSVIATNGYNELVRQSGVVNDGAERTRAVQRGMHRISQDFSFLEPRPVREPLGDSIQPALRADIRNDVLVEFTRAGWSNPAGLPRSTLQRVSYRLQDGKLYREYWHMLDRTLAEEPVRTVLFDGVDRVTLRFLDGNQNWQEQWPALGVSGNEAPRTLPAAVEIKLELQDWGELVRLIEVPG